MIELVSVSKVFRIPGGKKIKVLDGIDFVLEDGKFVVLTGPSGGGKTTMLKILSGMEKPTKGKVLYDKKDYGILFDLKASSYRNKYIGFIFQTFRLMEELTVIENIMIPLYIKGQIWKVGEKKVKEYVMEILEKLGIADYTYSYPASLSGGQKQRVAIARALIQKPKYIFADEAIANLDNETAKNIVSILQKLNKEDGITILFVSHQSMVLNIADEIYKLENGKITRISKEDVLLNDNIVLNNKER